LHDLVSYNEKHNEANGEGNRDGSDDNRSWNCGVEGPTDDVHIIALREQQKRNFLTTLLLSQGVPMILHGDEFGRTQRGNNNAYCQDNEISWMDWRLAVEHEVQLSFTRKLTTFRKEHPVFRRRRFFDGKPVPHVAGEALPDIAWFTPAAALMTETDWETGYAKSLTVFVNGDAIPSPDRRGQPVRDDSFLLLFNADANDLEFRLPDEEYGQRWEAVIDTTDPLLIDPPTYKAQAAVTVPARCVLVLRRVL
ncbi:MAG: glycogen debranching enzyme, partial [Acidothermus cellulolyticus]|jgi:isoamylase|nr:glycogen debranching enzyme [Acidothermus cellulolyticus]